jgi:hypothetical protein
MRRLYRGSGNFPSRVPWFNSVRIILAVPERWWAWSVLDESFYLSLFDASVCQV